MKLEQVAKHRFLQEGSPLSYITIPNVGLLCLVVSTRDWRYRLVAVDDAGATTIDLEALPPHEHGNRPALLATGGEGFTIAASTDLVFHYPRLGGPALSIRPRNRKLLRQVVPSDARVVSYSSPFSNSTSFPVSFEAGRVQAEEPRHWAILDIDVSRGQAAWTNWASLRPTQLEHYQYDDPPKVEALAMRHDELLVSTIGGKTTSVNKWGMDYYALLATQADGDLTSVTWGGTALPNDNKKHGVSVSFTTSGEYAVLTPTFASGSWKGAQRLLDLATGEVDSVQLPRGSGKYARIIQHLDGNFWIWNAQQEGTDRYWSVMQARLATSE
ncbi:hypothetical protein [Agreia bicolorata]|uniref:hypothetical protein n=1 Tax=Agreia bicolorata TaxID=110935 RepID=UPI001117023E|nr:hypothetical protein [Agreia bicolorata]